MTSQRRAASGPQESKSEPKSESADATNAERPLDGTGLGTGNVWDLAYASNVPPKLNTSPLPPSEDAHLGTLADPTPRDEYTVPGQIAKQAEAGTQNKEA